MKRTGISMKKVAKCCSIIFLFIIIFSFSSEASILFETGLNSSKQFYDEYGESVKKHGVSYQFGIHYRHQLKNERYALRVGLLLSNWHLKHEYEYNQDSLPLPFEPFTSFDRYDIAIEVDEHWSSFQIPVLLETHISPLVYFLTGFIFVFENAAEYEASADATLYDDIVDTSYSYTDIKEISAEFDSNYDKDDLENDIYLTIGTGMRIDKSVYFLSPEITFSYCLTPDRKNWEIEKPVQYFFRFSLLIEFDIENKINF